MPDPGVVIASLFNSRQIADAIGGQVLKSGPSGAVTANNRTLTVGEWFIALKGPGYDDHTFLPEAARRGAAGLIVMYPPDNLDIPMVVVPDTWKALAQLAHAARLRCGGPVVAITGSTGKTTTRDLTALALSVNGVVHQTTHNHNARPGVSLTLLSCPETAWAQVIEFGTYKPGEIAFHAGIVLPDVRLITSIGPAHLEGLTDLEGVTKEKAVLFDTARPGDTCIVNLEDPRLADLSLPAGVRKVTYGADGQVALIQAVFNPDTLTTQARWRTPSGNVACTLPSPARYVAENATAALAVAWSQDVDRSAAALALERYEPTGFRLRQVPVHPGALVFNDCFNANPVSVSAALRMVAALPGRRCAVIGDMLELGPNEDRYHTEIIDLALQLEFDLLVLVGPRMNRAGVGVEAVLVLEPMEAVDVLRDWLAPGDRVLVKGSRKMRMERIVAALA